MFTCEPFSIYCMDLLGIGGRRLKRLKLQLSLLVVSVVQPLPGTQGCVVLSPPLPRLLDDSNNFLLSPFCEISLGQE